MEILKLCLIGIGCVIVFSVVSGFLDRYSKNNKIKSGKLIKTEAKVVGVLGATIKKNVGMHRGGDIFVDSKIKDRFLILEFDLVNGTTVRQKSTYVMSANVTVGDTIQIIYNPEYLREIYLWDE